jgi:hypothetical protein
MKNKSKRAGGSRLPRRRSGNSVASGCHREVKASSHRGPGKFGTVDVPSSIPAYVDHYSHDSSGDGMSEYEKRRDEIEYGE